MREHWINGKIVTAQKIPTQQLRHFSELDFGELNLAAFYTVGAERWAKYQTTKDDVSAKRFIAAKRTRRWRSNPISGGQRNTPPCATWPRGLSCSEAGKMSTLAIILNRLSPGPIATFRHALSAE